MIIYIGADHRGFNLKNEVKSLLKEKGYEVIDLGNTKFQEGDDYPDFASQVAGRVSLEFGQAKGVLLCGSGVGMSVVANKYPNVRAALVTTADQAYDARKEDDANILVVPANHTESDKLKNIVMTFFETPFLAEERYVRRIKMISEIETKQRGQSGEPSQK